MTDKQTTTTIIIVAFIKEKTQYIVYTILSSFCLVQNHDFTDILQTVLVFVPFLSVLGVKAEIELQNLNDLGEQRSSINGVRLGLFPNSLSV